MLGTANCVPCGIVFAFDRLEDSVKDNRQQLERLQSKQSLMVGKSSSLLSKHLYSSFLHIPAGRTPLSAGKGWFTERMYAFCIEQQAKLFPCRTAMKAAHPQAPDKDDC